MGTPKPVQPVLFFIGVLYSFPEIEEKGREKCQEIWGPIEKIAPQTNFDQTSYYNHEMGNNIFRSFWIFENLIDPIQLAAIKHKTNALEKELATTFPQKNFLRPINLDPGYVSLAKLVLATTKNHQHRIYIGQNIWAEVTLRYQNKHFTTWEWTYPDYARPIYLDFFTEERKKYLEKLRKQKLL